MNINANNVKESLSNHILADGMDMIFDEEKSEGSYFVDKRDGRKFVDLQPAEITNTHALGRLIYTEYIYLFQSAGLVLLVAMIGAIVLTLRKRPNVRRQRISEQISRPVEDVIEIKDIPTGSGI